MTDDIASRGDADRKRPGAQSCCRPAPQSGGGSCCGDSAEPAAFDQQSACCETPTQHKGRKLGQSSCCGAPPLPPPDYRYGPAAYVTGTRGDARGPRLAGVSRDHSQRSPRRLARALGLRPRRLPRAARPLRPGNARCCRPRTGHRQLQAHLRRAALFTRRSRCLAAGHRHARHQRLVRCRQGHLLRRGGRTAGLRDAAG